MDAILELFSAYGVSPEMVTVGGGVIVIGVLAFVVKKKLSKKKKSANGGGGYDYGESTTTGYDTKAGNYVDELNMDSVLTQDVQGFAIPDFDKSELEKSTGAQKYRKKIINAATPGMTLGDTRPMQVNDDDDLGLELGVHRPKTLSLDTSGLRPKAMNPNDIMAMTTMGTGNLKVLNDVEMAIRPASPEKVSQDSPVQSINIPMSMGVSKMGVGNSIEDFDLDFGEAQEVNTPEYPTDLNSNFIEPPLEIESLESRFTEIKEELRLPEISIKKETIVELNFHNLPEIKNTVSNDPEISFFSIDSDSKGFDFKGLGEKEELRIVEDEPTTGMPVATTARVLKQSYKPPVEVNNEPESVEFLPGELRLVEDDEKVKVDVLDLSDIPGLNLNIEDSVQVNPSGVTVDTIDDLSDIPGLNLNAVEDVSIQEEEVFASAIKSSLDESLYPETIAYHQEIEKALFLDAEEMKEQALHILNNTVELVSNVKVRFYFKLAIQSYSNSLKENALSEIIKNFYDFEYQKYSK